MINLFFVANTGEKHKVLFELDRKNKIFFLTSTKTKLERKSLPWKMLFDPGKEIVQEKLTNEMDDKQFMTIFTAKMIQEGYRLENGSIR